MISQSDLFKLFRMISRCVIGCDECALRFYVCSIFVDRVFVLFIFHHGVHWTYKCFAYVAPRGWIWVRRGLGGFGDIRGSVGRYDPRGIKATGFAVTTKINHYAAVTPSRPRSPRRQRRSKRVETRKRPRTSSEEKTRPRRARETRRPGQGHPGRAKQEEPPPPGQEKPGAGAPDKSVRSGTGRRRRRLPDWIIQRHVAADAQDWNIQGHVAADAQDWIIRGEKQQEPPTPGLEHPGTKGGRRPDRIVRGKTIRSGHNPRTGTTGEKRRDAQGRIVRGETSSMSPDPPDRTGRSTKDAAKEEQRHRAEDEAEGMQGSEEVAGPRGSGAAGQRVRPR